MIQSTTDVYRVAVGPSFLSIVTNYVHLFFPPVSSCRRHLPRFLCESVEIQYKTRFFIVRVLSALPSSISMRHSFWLLSRSVTSVNSSILTLNCQFYNLLPPQYRLKNGLCLFNCLTSSQGIREENKLF